MVETGGLQNRFLHKMKSANRNFLVSTEARWNDDEGIGEIVPEAAIPEVLGRLRSSCHPQPPKRTAFCNELSGLRPDDPIHSYDSLLTLHATQS